MADNTALNEALQNLEFTFAEQTSTILKTVINMDTTVFYEGQDIADAGLLAELATDEMVRVDAVFNRVLSGTVSFLLEKSLVAKIVDFMIMGDGQVDFMADEHLDGILEGVNQVMGAEITRLNGKLGVELRADVDKASVIPAGDLARTFDGWLLVRFTVEIEGQGSFRMFKLYESGLKDQLGRLLIGDTAQRGSEPAGRPAAASAGSAGGSSSAGAPKEVRTAQFGEFPQPGRGGMMSMAGILPEGLERVMDILLPVVIELGRTRMLIKEIIDLAPGAIIELDKLTGEPVELYVNGKKFALGEVVVVDENFGVRITELVKIEERLASLPAEI